MANVLINENTMKEIADSIREKAGTDKQMLPGEMPAAIKEITAGLTKEEADGLYADKESFQSLFTQVIKMVGGGVVNNQYVDMDSHNWKTLPFPTCARYSGKRAMDPVNVEYDAGLVIYAGEYGVGRVVYIVSYVTGKSYISVDEGVTFKEVGGSSGGGNNGESQQYEYSYTTDLMASRDLISAEMTLIQAGNQFSLLMQYTFPSELKNGQYVDTNIRNYLPAWFQPPKKFAIGSVFSTPGIPCTISAKFDANEKVIEIPVSTSTGSVNLQSPLWIQFDWIA